MVKLFSVLKVSVLTLAMIFTCNAFAGYYMSYAPAPCESCYDTCHSCHTVVRHHYRHHAVRHHYRHHYYSCSKRSAGGYWDVQDYQWQETTPGCREVWAPETTTGCGGRCGGYYSQRSPVEVIYYYNNYDTGTMDGDDY